MRRKTRSDARAFRLSAAAVRADSSVPVRRPAGLSRTTSGRCSVPRKSARIARELRACISALRRSRTIWLEIPEEVADDFRTR